MEFQIARRPRLEPVTKWDPSGEYAIEATKLKCAFDTRLARFIFFQVGLVSRIKARMWSLDKDSSCNARMTDNDRRMMFEKKCDGPFG